MNTRGNLENSKLCENTPPELSISGKVSRKLSNHLHD